ncbi:2-C-methyl-D-erythritol 4-phosphate cytidylyltransferase [Marinicella rhabdoformis]|uniref:2-C-methyl-D-erythritol 4-phosphate cytidylyltransferase n=1 Tax=Marinicella rhabdoformis TaxID=2580566 RepID=UPI0012AEB66E|nr:2-C-methyl-D-erythritol 4-phosphate cytidylyltransferase [Marinicella rhabdoformis]
MSKPCHFHVLITAAGIGSRFESQSGLPKQYHQIGDKTVLAHTIEAFNDIDCDIVMVTTHPDDKWWPEIKFQSKQLVKSCIGGSSRKQSVINGLLAIKEKAQDTDWILVHDAARPCITPDDINRLINAVKSHAVGGLLVKPVTDTIKKSTDKSHCQTTIDRDQLFAALTPQMFRLGDLLHHLQQADDDKTTDEASAFEQAGKLPLMVLGNCQNIKITYPSDLALAHFYLQQQGRL